MCVGTFRASRDVRLASVTRRKADIHKRDGVMSFRALVRHGPGEDAPRPTFCYFPPPAPSTKLGPTRIKKAACRLSGRTLWTDRWAAASRSSAPAGRARGGATCQTCEVD